MELKGHCCYQQDANRTQQQIQQDASHGIFEKGTRRFYMDWQKKTVSLYIDYYYECERGYFAVQVDKQIASVKGTFEQDGQEYICKVKGKQKRQEKEEDLGNKQFDKVKGQIRIIVQEDRVNFKSVEMKYVQIPENGKPLNSVLNNLRWSSYYLMAEEKK